MFHHPADATVEILDAKVDVDPTLVHGRIRGIHEVPQEIRYDLEHVVTVRI